MRWLRYGWLVTVMLLAPGVQAQSGDSGALPAQAEVSVSAQPMEAETGAVEKKTRGKTLFWFVLVIALLFIVGSATALNALGGSQPQQRKEDERKR